MPRSQNPYTISRNKALSEDEIKENIYDFAYETTSIIPCKNLNSNFQTTCRCMEVFSRDDGLMETLVVLLNRYERYSSKERQLLLHSIVTHGFIAKEKLKRGSYKDPVYLLTGVSSDNVENVKVCQNSLMNLFYIAPRAWKKIASDATLPGPKDTSNYRKNTNPQDTEVKDSVTTFLIDLGDQEGESHATRFVRTETELFVRDEELELIQLPPCYSKRQLYEKYCFERGWLAKCNAKGTYPALAQLKRREFDDDNGELALLPSGSTPEVVCSWRTFLRLWGEHVSHIKIRPPACDTCVSCNIFRNISKYKATRNNQLLPDAQIELICPETNEVSLLKKPADEEEIERENIILAAAKHVKAARSQKLLANEKIESAKASHQQSPGNSNTITLVVDYCQNLDLPHLGGEQPGGTYYYSPIWLYCLGIVNVAEEMLYAYVYQECSAKKGANNVASCIMHFLITKIFSEHQLLRHNCPKDELNIIMDNCGG